MVDDVLSTLGRVAQAYAVGTAIGFCCGILCGISKRPRRLLKAILSALLVLPGMALAPLAIILLGFGDRAIVAVGIVAAAFPVAYNTLAGIENVAQELTEAAAIDGATRLETLHWILLPLTVPYVTTGLRLAMTKTWRTVIAVEFVAAANTGIGYAILDAMEYLRLDIALRYVTVVAITHVILTKVFNVAETLTVECWEACSRVRARRVRGRTPGCDSPVCVS